MAEPIRVLDDDHLLQINEALDRARQAKQLIEQAERGGIDMEEQKTQTNDMEVKLLKIKRAYFPGR